MIFLERAKEEEMSQIHRIQKLTFEKLYAKYQDEGSPFNELESSLIAKSKKKNYFYFFIKLKEETIGYACIVTNEEGTQAKIGPIGILPQYEECGYGTEAMKLIEKEFSTVKEWLLDTILQETKLTHFYSKLGYKQTGKVESIQENMAIIFFEKRVD